MPTDPTTINGPHLTFDEFDAIFEKLKTWSDYSPETIERGALNFITPEIVKSALQSAKQGVVVPTALAWNTTSGPDNAKPALHFMTEMGDDEAPEPTANKDFIGVDYHGKAASHLDSMTHIAYKGLLFGGVTSADVVHSWGSTWATVDKLGPVVTRGVLLDAARFYEVDWLEPGTAVTKADVLAMEAKFGFTISQGDCVLLRSGHFARREKVGVWDPSNLSAGFHVDVMELFKERKVSVIGGDGDSDVRPSPVTGVGSPIHVLALPGMGIPLLDNLQLEALGKACAQHQQWNFLINLAPLNIPGGTGSPLNPTAVL
ncbi:MAG: cyclase family protein [Actinomycetes bacterium]